MVKPRKDPSRSMHVALPHGLKERITKAAQARGQSPSAWLVTVAFAALQAKPTRANATPAVCLACAMGKHERHEATPAGGAPCSCPCGVPRVA